MIDSSRDVGACHTRHIGEHDVMDSFPFVSEALWCFCVVNVLFVDINSLSRADVSKETYSGTNFLMTQPSKSNL